MLELMHWLGLQVVILPLVLTSRMRDKLAQNRRSNPCTYTSFLKRPSTTSSQKLKLGIHERNKVSKLRFANVNLPSEAHPAVRAAKSVD
eukprot:4934236-Amphidinium_carterae.1